MLIAMQVPAFACLLFEGLIYQLFVVERKFNTMVFADSIGMIT